MGFPVLINWTNSFQILKANSGDPDRAPPSVTSGLGICPTLRTLQNNMFGSKLLHSSTGYKTVSASFKYLIFVYSLVDIVHLTHV